MNALDQMTDAQKDLVVALPYRVGLWVSKSDTHGGEESAQRELQALSNILQGFAQDVFGSALVQHVMHETWARKAQWPEWGERLTHIPMECSQAMDILREHVDEKEVKVYVMRLMEIAEAVALAFREHGQRHTPGEMLSIYALYIKAFVYSKLNKQPLRALDQFLNVSARERKTLRLLAQALGTHNSF